MSYVREFLFQYFSRKPKPLIEKDPDDLLNTTEDLVRDALKESVKTFMGSTPLTMVDGSINPKWIFYLGIAFPNYSHGDIMTYAQVLKEEEGKLIDLFISNQSLPEITWMDKTIKAILPEVHYDPDSRVTNIKINGDWCILASKSF